MSRVIEEQKTIYQYEELSDEAKREVIYNDVEEVFFELNDAEIAKEEFTEIAEDILKESDFRGAEITDFFWDFSYSQGSGAVVCFNMNEKEIENNFPRLKEYIGTELLDGNWKEKYNLTDEEFDELLNTLRTKELSSICDIKFEVKHDNSKYANYESDYDVNCYLNQEIRYCFEDIVEDWIYHHLHNSKRLEDVESEFSHRAYEWYDKLTDVNNYNNNDFEDRWYYEDGKFAGYGSDLGV